MKSTRCCAALLLLALLPACRTTSIAQERPAAVAGSFYPAEPAQLANTVDRALAAAPVTTRQETPLAIVVPHAGYQYSGAVAAQAYALLKGKSYRRVIVIGPSHVEPVAYTSVYSGDSYATPLGELPVDREFARKLAAAHRSIRADVAGHRADKPAEHSVEVQLPFLQRALGSFTVVPVVMGNPSYANSRALGIALARLLKNDSSTLLVASSDLSHFHPYEQAARMDRNLLNGVVQGDFLSVSHNVEQRVWEACGIGPMLAVMIAAERLGGGPVLLGYANSGDVTADKKRVVGYGAVAFYRSAVRDQSPPFVMEERDKAALADIARRSVELAVRERKLYEPDTPASRTLLEERGAFVTLTKDGILRGCIGHVSPMAPVYKTVAEVAALAALRDPRFPPVRADELSKLEYEVSVLSPFAHVLDTGAIRVGEHGLLIRRGNQEGLLLPQVATAERWDREEFLRQACGKAGLDPEGCPDGETDVFTFTALYFPEKTTQPSRARQ